MKATLAVLFITLGVVSAGGWGYGAVNLVGPPAPGAVLQGPSSKTTLVGPDGSHVAGVAAGGTVAAAPIPGGVVSAAVAPGAVLHGAAPIVAPAIVPAVAAVPSVAVGHGGAVISGPSGTVYGSVQPGGWVGGVGLAAAAVGVGHEGQWVPDGTENLYDDGSYKGDFHAW